jgi:hypothetical protein
VGLSKAVQNVVDKVDVNIIKVVDKNGLVDKDQNGVRSKGDIIRFRIDVVADARNVPDPSQKLEAYTYIIEDVWSNPKCTKYVKNSTDMWRYDYVGNAPDLIHIDDKNGGFPLDKGNKFKPNATLNVDFKLIEIDFDFEITCDCFKSVNTAKIIEDYGNYDYEIGQLLLSVNFDTRTGGVCGDPHFKGWSGEKYDFHGVCDLVLVQNPSFHNGLGMDIHVRTKKTRMWSYIDTAVVRIGDDTLEVKGGAVEKSVWINKQEVDNLDDSMAVSGYPITYAQLNTKSRQFVIDLGNGEEIEIKSWNTMVSVNVKGARKEDFGGSVGLLGSFPDGLRVGRDKVSILNDRNTFGQEWQVRPMDGQLFHVADGPQFPEQCEIPSSVELRRRLAEATISKEDAEIACARVNEEDFDLCVFDVMATNDKENAGAY